VIDLIIIRLPDDVDGTKQFAELNWSKEKGLSDTGNTFSVGPESSYNEMRFDHIVLAYRIEGGSHDVDRFAVNDDLTHGPAVIHQVPFEILREMVEYMIETHMALN
jgi:hypothetical protein